MLADQLDYIVGVDPHRDVHAVAVVHVLSGAVVFEANVAASSDGYAHALALVEEYSTGRRAFAIEGTGSFGAGLTRFLTGRGERVLELGFVLVKLFNRKGGGGPAEMSVFHLTATFTNVATGATTSLLDVGPDRLTFDRNGNPIVTIIGRSLTGSGVIGRVVIDATTGAVLSSSGRVVGDWVENVCAELT